MIDEQPPRYCFDCRRLKPFAELVTRQRVVSVSRGTISHPFSVFSSHSSSETYRLVDVCMTCEAQALHDGRQRMIEQAVGLGSVGLLLFGYWQIVLTAIAGWFGVKAYKRYGWRVKRKVKQLKLTWRNHE